MNFEFGNAIASALARASLPGCGVLLIVGVICLITPNLSPRWKSWMWRLAWLRVAYALCTNATVELPLLAKKVQVGAPTASVASSFAAVASSFAELPVPVENSANSPHVGPPSSPAAVKWQTVLVSTWAVGAGAIGLCRLAQFLKAGSLRRRTQPASQEAIELLHDICRELRIREPALAISDSAPGPLLVGVLRPCVILPSTFLNAPRERLEFALRHELAHLQRQDLTWIYFVTVVQTALWFHPIVWWAARESRLVQEIACDQMALRSGNRAAEFAEMLVELSRSNRASIRQFAAGIIETKSTLRRRLNAMKALQTGKTANAWIIGMTVAAVIAAIAPINIIADREPPAVSKPEQKPDLLEQRRIEDATRSKNLEKLQQELQELSLKYTDQHPTIIATKQKIALLQTEMNGDKATQPKTVSDADSLLVQHPEIVKRYFPQLVATTTQNKSSEPADTENTNGAGKQPSDRQTREVRLRKAAKESTRVNLRARSPGVVAQVMVKPGDHVKAGWELVRLNNEEADIRLRTAKAELNIAESEHGLKHVTGELQIADMQNTQMRPAAQAAELQKLKLQLTRADAELELARAKYDSVRLEVGGFIIKAPADGVVDQIPPVGETLTPNSVAVGFFPDPTE